MARPKSIHKFIRERRKETGYTLNDLGKKIGVTGATISNWEKGKSKPSQNELKKLTKYLGDFNKVNEVIPESSTSFGVWLRTVRTKKDMTIQELADKSNLPYVTIYQIENGKINSPRLNTKVKLERGLKEKYSDFSENEKTDFQNKGIGEFLEFNPFDDNDRPTDPGIYVLYDVSERPIYVGEGQNIKSRIKDHIEKFWFKQPIVQTGAYIEVKDKDLRKDIETILIKFLKSNAVINKQNVDRNG